MPGAKTYQAIGYATYHGGKLYGKQKRAELERAQRRRRNQAGGGAALAALAVVAVVAVVARRASRTPTV